MSDILSQEELDALLDINVYDDLDFDDAFSLEENSLDIEDKAKQVSQQPHIIYEEIVKSLKVQFSNIISQKVDIKSCIVKKMRLDEFVISLPKKANLNLFSIDSLDRHGIIIVDSSLAYSMIDILMGGDGDFFISDKEFSQIEYDLFKIVLNAVLEGLKFTFKLDMVLNSKIYTSDVTFDVIGYDTVVVLTVEVVINNYSEMINICLPDLLSQTFSQSPDISFEVDLGEVELTLDEILSLKVDDIIKVADSVNGISKVYVDGKDKFLGKIGSSGADKSIRIIQERVTDE